MAAREDGPSAAGATLIPRATFGRDGGYYASRPARRGNRSQNGGPTLLAGARALLFPTTVNEAFGLVMVEALLSGTPVICSDRGACPEIISEEVGFVCGDEADYLGALREVGHLSRRRCREWALSRFDYRRMVREYLLEYERERDGWTG